MTTRILQGNCLDRQRLTEHAPLLAGALIEDTGT